MRTCHFEHRPSHGNTPSSEVWLFKKFCALEIRNAMPENCDCQTFVFSAVFSTFARSYFVRSPVFLSFNFFVFTSFSFVVPKVLCDMQTHRSQYLDFLALIRVSRLCRFQSTNHPLAFIFDLLRQLAS